MSNDIVLSCYLIGKDDPQRRLRWPADNDATVATWIRSLHSVGLRGVIFHDGLSPEFCHKWDGFRVEFRMIEWVTPWTAAEERVAIYRAAIASEPDWDRILMTDLSDVEFHFDPFPLMADRSKLYVGSEVELLGATILRLWSKAAYGEIKFPDRPVLNCGIVGGHRAPIMHLLNVWMAEMALAGVPPPPHDIVAFNRVMYGLALPYFTGGPLHTAFRKNQGPESGCCIRHK